MLHELISNEKPLITAGMSALPNSAKLRRKYQFASRYGDQVELFHEDGDLLWLPRALFPVGKTDQRKSGTGVNFPNCPEPRESQVDMFNDIETEVGKGHTGVFVAPTGFGKTVLGYLIAFLTQEKVCVVTTKSDIYQRWIEDAPKFLGISPDEVGEIRQDKCEIEGKSFCVALVQSLSKPGKYPDWIFEVFGCVIFDECHRFPADQFSSIVGRFTAKYRYGLSATPNRKDGKETLFYSHIGPVLAKAPEALMIPNVLRFKSEWKCPRQLVMMKDGTKKVKRIPHEAGHMGHIEKILAVDDDRNALIAKGIVAAKNKGRNIVVFSTQHIHLHQIEHALKKMKVSAKDIGWYVSASTKAEKARNEEATTRQIVLTTYQMMGEGTSIDWLDTAVFAMPRASVTQPAGRIRREFEDKRFPLILDIVDTDSPVLRSYSTSRLDWYKEIGAKVEDMF